MFYSNTNQKNISVNKKSVTPPAPSYDEDMLKGVLRRYDTDGDGVLSRKELKKAFNDAGTTAPGWRAIRALCHADKNRDGCINEKELPNLVHYANKQGPFL